MKEITNIIEKPKVNSVDITLSSGQNIIANQIKLFNSEQIELAKKIEAEARENLGEFGTGLGFLGSPGWVVSGSLILGGIEDIISDGRKKKGLIQLNKSIDILNTIRNSGIFFNLSEVYSIKYSQPNLWHASKHRTAKKEIKQEKWWKDESIITNVSIDEKYIHNGVKFIIIKTKKDEVISVNWELLESYRVTLEKH